MTVQSTNESSLLAGILFDPRALAVAVEERVRAEDFTRIDTAAIFKAMVALDERGEHISAVTVTNELERAGALEAAGGPVAISRLEGEVPTAAHVRPVAREVRNAAQLRELSAACREVITDCELGYEQPQDIIETAERRVLAVARDTGSAARSTKQLVQDATARLEKAYERKSALTGVTSGLDVVDQLTGGWGPGDLIVIAARPAMGKTAFVLQNTLTAACLGVAAALFSLEMGPDQLTDRMLGSEAGIDIQALRRGFVKPGDWQRLSDASARVSDAPLFIEDTPGLSIGEMRARCRRLKKKHDIKLAVVDYLQLMSGPPEYRGQKTQEVGEISKGLKSIARELEIPVIALSQLNRGVEQRSDKRPLMSDLRESGAIEQDADLVGFLYREEYYLKEKTPDDQRGMAEFIVAKHRNGPTGSVDLAFKASTTRFSEVQRSHEYV